MAALDLNDPCLLGYTNGTYLNGTMGMGTWSFGHYKPSSHEMMMCQAANGPWGESVKYAHWTMYLFAGFVLIIGLVNMVKRFNAWTISHGVPESISPSTRLSAFARALSYPQPIAYLPPLGPLLVWTGFGIFGMAVSFGIRPYYRPAWYGSSPLGLRTEWIATAMIVWIIALGVKKNALSWLTGVSYARLLTMHKLLPWLCLFFSAVHTGAMIIRGVRQSSWAYTLEQGPLYYGWAAWGALGALTWLCVLSLPIIREWSYELFYIGHMVNCLLFIVFMYYHCDNLLASWQYLHPAVVVLGTAMLWRLGAVAWLHRCFTSIPRATIDVLDDTAIKVTIPVNERIRWTPGQHFYVRFLSLRPWETHPFTVTSLPRPERVQLAIDTEKQRPESTTSDAHELVFVLRQQGGMTARLGALASKTMPVILDGPYGDFSPLCACDSVLLIAGGSGMSLVQPIFTALVRDMGAPDFTQAQFPTAARRVKCVWTVREASSLTWFDVDAASGKEIAVEVVRHVSGQAGAGDKKEVLSGRPDVAALVRSTVALGGRRVGVLCCGPSSLMVDVRNAVAAEQRHILRGRSEVAELELYEEAFEM